MGTVLRRRVCRDLLTTREAADLLRVRPLTVALWVRAGKLPAVPMGDGGLGHPRDQVLDLAAWGGALTEALTALEAVRELALSIGAESEAADIGRLIDTLRP
ncbi:excisionase family DNA binding protein [Nocardiopsis sp. Huas11]|uniref:helix-turn-helix domain-containing protein n=1 Tax=Nocardiopsis sp. Huas11 TaxID=2183912 RepID=UPI000F236EEB|nr:helix-turn-helix domain-containing protein [Nocardiopsis sp. Huas11]RKS05767.1 excisionase family DNA binding protein [Nocardiopsis sp. Huas11]